MAKPAGKGNGNDSTAATPPDGAILGTADADLITPLGDIFSTAGDDIIWAYGGDDEIDAGDGNDTVEAGDGNDTITGGAGDDTLNGGAGDDIFIEGPGTGSDTIDGGDGYDTVIYDGFESDYTIDYITETRGKKEIITGFIVTNNTTGEVDTLNSIDQLVFAGVPTGTIITQGDFEFVQFDQTATIDPLANDYLEGGNPGEGLTLTAILDVQIDLDGDGVNDLDLIPDGATLADFQSGVTLNDGSVAGTGSLLTLNPDGTLTWDPNGIYDTEPGAGETAPVIQFWYEASDGLGGAEYGDVTFQVVYPAPPGDVTFETMTLWDPIFYSYIDGPDGKYLVSQMNDLGWFEERDAGATNFDYDGDGDDEFRIWTDGTGEHYLNLRHRDAQEFTVESATLTGLDAGEEATFWFADAYGTVIGTAVIDETDLDANGVVTFSNPQPIGQLVVFSDGTGEFYIDDITFV